MEKGMVIRKERGRDCKERLEEGEVK